MRSVRVLEAAAEEAAEVAPWCRRQHPSLGVAFQQTTHTSRPPTLRITWQIGPFTSETRKEVLRRLLALEKQVGRRLIEDAEKVVENAVRQADRTDPVS